MREEKAVDGLPLRTVRRPTAGLYRCGWLYSMTAKSDTNLWKPEGDAHTRRRRVTGDTPGAETTEFGKKRVKRE